MRYSLCATMTPLRHRRIPRRILSVFSIVLILAAGLAFSYPFLAKRFLAQAATPVHTGGLQVIRFWTQVPPAPAAYYRPMVIDEFTFPVARSNWFRVLHFDNGWNAPRMRVVNGTWQLVGVHKGIDIVAEEGTPILSASAGTVERVGWTFYSGTRVGVRGTDGRYYFYAHLAAVAPDIVPGTPVEPGSVLGLVGNTGYGPPGTEDRFIPHLHFGVQEGATWVNPYPLLVTLYEASAREAARDERHLARLNRRGRANAAAELRGEMYLDLPGLLEYPGGDPRSSSEAPTASLR